MQRPSHLHARPVRQFGAVEAGPAHEAPARPLGRPPTAPSPAVPTGPATGPCPLQASPRERSSAGAAISAPRGATTSRCRRRGPTPPGAAGSSRSVTSVGHAVIGSHDQRHDRATAASRERGVDGQTGPTGSGSPASGRRSRPTGAVCSTERSPDTVTVRSIRSTLVAPSPVRSRRARTATSPRPSPSGWRTSARSPPCTAPGRPGAAGTGWGPSSSPPTSGPSSATKWWRPARISPGSRQCWSPTPWRSAAPLSPGRPWPRSSAPTARPAAVPPMTHSPCSSIPTFVAPKQAMA